MNLASSVPDKVVMISDYATERGGASRLALLLALALQSRNVPVSVFCGDHGAQSQSSEIEFTGISGTSLLEQGKASAMLRGIWNRSARDTLARVVRQTDTPRTIYHVHGFLQTLSPAIFAALHPVRSRVVIHAHDYFLACPNGAFFDYRSGTECGRTPISNACIRRHCDKRSYPQKVWRLVRQVVQNRLTADFLTQSRIILIHERMLSYLERGGRQIAKATTIRNPAQPFLSTPAQPRSRLAFLFVGDIHAYKGVFDLAEAARQAQVPLWFAGEGVDRPGLQDRFPEFHYAGWQDRAGLAALARQVRAVVVPTLGPEPFGLTLVEALACGLPVIVSDRALLAPEIEAAGAGLTFRAGESGDLARVLSRVAMDDSLVERMSRNALSAGNQFAKSTEEWCAEIMQVYSDVLCSRFAAVSFSDNPDPISDSIEPETATVSDSPHSLARPR